MSQKQLISTFRLGRVSPWINLLWKQICCFISSRWVWFLHLPCNRHWNFEILRFKSEVFHFERFFYQLLWWIYLISRRFRTQDKLPSKKYINPFRVNSLFLYLRGFLMFSGSIERDHWHECVKVTSFIPQS